MKRAVIAVAAAAVLTAGIFLLRPAAEDRQREGGSAPGVERSAAEATNPPGSKFIESHVEPLPAGDTAFDDRVRKINSMPPDGGREKAVRELANEWAAEDPAAAERWAGTLENPAERERALTHVCLTVSDRKPQDAVDMAKWYHLNEGIIEAIAGRWAERDFESAAAWVSRLPQDELRDRLLSRVVFAHAETAPEEAAAIVSDAFMPGEAQQEAAISVLHQWLLKDPEAAQRWVEAFPDSPLKERAAAEISGLAAYREEQAK